MEVYPKVKVRGQEEDDENAYAINYLSLHDFSPVEECKDDSLMPMVRIAEFNISNSMPMSPVSKGTTKNPDKKVVEESKANIRASSGATKNIDKKVVEESKANIKASSIPRPRAVLSSPDNDAMLGSKIKRKTELLSGLKNHNLCENRHVQCKVTSSPVAAGSPISKRRDSEGVVAHSRNDIQGIKGSALADPSKKPYLRRGKPHNVQS